MSGPGSTRIDRRASLPGEVGDRGQAQVRGGPPAGSGRVRSDGANPLEPARCDTDHGDDSGREPGEACARRPSKGRFGGAGGRTGADGGARRASWTSVCPRKIRDTSGHVHRTTSPKTLPLQSHMKAKRAIHCLPSHGFPIYYLVASMLSSSRPVGDGGDDTGLKGDGDPYRMCNFHGSVPR